MDRFDLFRKLGIGAKFDFKRFQSDAQKLKVQRPLGNKNQFPAENKPDVSIGESQKKRKSDGDLRKGKRKRVDEAESEDDTESDDEGDDSTSSADEDSDERSEEEVEEEAEEEEEEEELTLLGSMKSGDQRNAKIKKKEKKKHAKMTAKKRASIKQEEINHLRKINRIHVQGTDLVDPVTSFEALTDEGLDPRVVENLRALGFTQPTPIQMQAIPFMMQRRELLACAPTGSGKTAAFVVPILHLLKGPRKEGFRALVLAPTRELATQIYRVFCQIAEGTGFRIHYIDKTSTAAKKFGPQSSQKFDILVTTPNRLVHMIKCEPPAISLKNLEWLIVDESDKLFEEGMRGFRDQLAAVYQACDGARTRRALFSATFAYDVEQWCRLNLDNVVQVYIGAKNSATDTVKQELVFVGGESGKRIAMRNIIQKGLTPPVLVFVQSKDRAKELFHELIYDGINVDVIHADRTQLQRDNIVKGFRAGRIWVLICTELMGRGIDFAGVNLVINYDLPTSAISYIHRVGRTGRAGRAGSAVSLFTESDGTNLRSIANVMKTSGCEVPDYMMKLAQPSKKDRRKLAKSAPHRKAISTVPKHDLRKAGEQRKRLKRLKGGPKGVKKNGESPGKKTPSKPHPAAKVVSHQKKKDVKSKDKLKTKNGIAQTVVKNKKQKGKRKLIKGK